MNEQKTETAFGPIQLTPVNRKYKCGKCGGEFNEGNALTRSQIDKGFKFCPFCDIDDRREMKK